MNLSKSLYTRGLKGMDDKLFKNSNNIEDNDLSNCEIMKMHLVGQGGFEKNYQTAIVYLFKSLEEGYEQCKNDYYETIALQKEYGRSIDKRIHILEKKGGVPIEYELIEKILGERNVDWFLKKQSVVNNDGAWIDRLEIETSNGEEVSYYFDISRSFGS